MHIIFFIQITMTLIQIYRSLTCIRLGTGTLLSFLLLTLVSPSSAETKPASTRQPVLIDAIAVVVNTDVITLKEIEERLRLVEQRLKRQNIQAVTRANDRQPCADAVSARDRDSYR